MKEGTRSTQHAPAREAETELQARQQTMILVSETVRLPGFAIVLEVIEAVFEGCISGFRTEVAAIRLEVELDVNGHRVKPAARQVDACCVFKNEQCVTPRPIYLSTAGSV